MRTSMAYFAGAGTVVVAIVAGVGGGLIMADIVSPKSPKQGTEQTLLERRMPPKPVQAAAAPSEPVPYLAAAQPSVPATAIAAAPAQPQAPTETANASPPVQPADSSQTRQAESPPKQAEAPAPQRAAPAAQPVVQVTAPDDSVAKARGGEARRAEGNRRFERRQQWTERRRYKPRHEQDLMAVEEKVREETEPRRAFAAEPARVEMPLIKLFGPD